MKPSEPHSHFGNVSQTIYGSLLETGDILTSWDVYESSSGHWEYCLCPGLSLTADNRGPKWIRPQAVQLTPPGAELLFLLEMYDGLTADQCLERYEAFQRDEWLDLPPLTSIQKEAARTLKEKIK